MTTVLTPFEIADLVWSRRLNVKMDDALMEIRMPDGSLEHATEAKHGWRVSTTFVKTAKMLPIKFQPVKVR